MIGVAVVGEMVYDRDRFIGNGAYLTESLPCLKVVRNTHVRAFVRYGNIHIRAIVADKVELEALLSYELKGLFVRISRIVKIENGLIALYYVIDRAYPSAAVSCGEGGYFVFTGCQISEVNLS